LIPSPSLGLAWGRPAAVYRVAPGAGSPGGDPFDLSGERDVLLGDRVDAPRVEADPDPVVVVLQVGMVVQLLTRLDQPSDEGDGLREASEPEPLVDLATLAGPAGEVGQEPVDVLVEERLRLRRRFPLST
jgi:hypothetical protein